MPPERKRVMAAAAEEGETDRAQTADQEARKRRVMAVGAEEGETDRAQTADQEARKRRVMAVGVFDLLHLGHVHYLTEAKRCGDELVVVVATDRMVAKRKHQPIMAEEQRAALVAALKPVDRAVIGHENDQLASVDDLKPDVIALGWDDYHNVDELKRKLAERGHDHVEVARMPRFEEHDLNGTRKIIRRILDRYQVDATVEGGA